MVGIDVERRVLVADDEPDVRLIVRLQLQRAGWVVDEAASGEEVLQRFQTGELHALVIDQRMAGISGLDTARALIDLGYDLPIVLFSAYLTPDVEVCARDLGLITLAKSEITTLADTLHALLEC
ncbi:MAG: response regulator [Actinobacteria bacterium]|nr:response regulator [Actinomycetota bacterium]